MKKKQQRSSDKGDKSQFSVIGVESGVNIYTCPDGNPIRYSTAHSASDVSKVETPVPGVFLLYNVLTPEECQQFIDLTEQMGYEEAKVTTFGNRMVSMPDLRNNERVMWQSTDDVWKPIWARIAPHLPESADMRSGKWTPYGLNERLRFYRYDKEEMFGAHFDGCFPRGRFDQSLLTFIVYLTDDFEGGCTRFYPSQHDVRPVKGMACIFWHGNHRLSPEHEGMLVTKGRKYVLRSDVMFRAEQS